MKNIYQITLLTLFSVCFCSCIHNSTQEKVLSFNVTSKKNQLSNKSGQEVSIDEMISISVLEGEKIIFKNFNFTLDNKIDGALNFYSENGKLMLLTPTELSTMNMPPDGNGIAKYKAGENIEISGTTLIKVNSISFVISNIRLK